MVRLAVVVPIWGRERLTQLMLESTLEQSRLVMYPSRKVGVDLFIVSSPGDFSDLGDDIIYSVKAEIHVNNSPICHKLNAGRALVQFDDDIYHGILGLGSDDFIDANYIRAAADACARGVDVWGVRDAYFYNEPDGQMIHWPGYTGPRAGEMVGPGRMLSRKFHELCDWKPWGDEADPYTDRAMNRTIERLRPQIQVETTSLRAIDAMLCDVKGPENLTPWGSMISQPGVVEAFPEERARFFELYEPE